MEVKEILNLIGAPETLDTVDGVKKHLSETFIARTLAIDDDDIRNKILGGRMGQIETVARNEFGFTPAQVKEKKIEDILKMASENFKSQIEEANKGKGEPAKEVKAWEDKYNKLNTDFTGLKGMFDTKTSEFEKEKMNLLGEVKNSKIGFILKDAVAKVKLKDNISEAERIGFNTVLNSDYKVDIGENDEIQIFGKDGKRVAKENNTGFITLDELIPSGAKNLGVLKVNNSEGGKQAGGFQKQYNQNEGAKRQAAPLRYGA